MAGAAPSPASAATILPLLIAVATFSSVLPAPILHESAPLVADNVSELVVQESTAHAGQARVKVARPATVANGGRLASQVVTQVGPNVKGAAGVQTRRMRTCPATGRADRQVVTPLSPRLVRRPTPRAEGDPRCGRPQTSRLASIEHSSRVARP